MRNVYCGHCKWDAGGANVYCQHPSCPSKPGSERFQWWPVGPIVRDTECRQSDKNRDYQCKDFSPRWFHVLNPRYWFRGSK